ncbi:MAG: hypothetical protein NE334_09105 [Lentisphaeraceae bacterium]|nr:hypothetical protein [Lentisphaeraceae bacterium]
MKRFTLKVSAELHAEIKDLGKQQEVLDAALMAFGEDGKVVDAKLDISTESKKKQIV